MGVARSIEHLNGCYERIDHHVQELQQVARVVAEAAVEQAALAKSGVFEDALVNGIAPDGTFEWPQTGIVQALRGAPQPNETDGWIRLDDAKVWITQHHPEQTPEKYGCRSWPQVLHESRCFRLEYRPGEDGRTDVVARWSASFGAENGGVTPDPANLAGQDFVSRIGPTWGADKAAKNASCYPGRRQDRPSYREIYRAVWVERRWPELCTALSAGPRERAA